MTPNQTNEFDPELLDNLLDDDALAELLGGALSKPAIQAKRSRGDWPYDTFRIGRKPHTDKRQIIRGIIAGRSPGKQQSGQDRLVQAALSGLVARKEAAQ